MSKNSKKSNSEAPVITSPDGVKIQITAGRKWKYNRAVQRDVTGRYSKLQKAIMAILIDSTNEGYGEDRSKWGYAYPSFERLAAECGCTPEAVKKNIPKLEEKKVLTVTRSAGHRASGKKGLGGGGGRDHSNMYFLHGWNEFGQIENGEQETVNGDHRSEETVNAKRETVNGKHGNGERRSRNGERRSPDSSLYSSHRNTSSYSENACGGRPVDDSNSERARSQPVDNSVDEPEGQAFSDRISRRERFEFLRSGYDKQMDREQPDFDILEAWKIFEVIDGEIGFEAIAIAILVLTSSQKPNLGTFADALHRIAIAHSESGEGDGTEFYMEAALTANLPVEEIYF